MRGENHRMAEGINNENAPKEGAWNTLQTDVERKPKVTFDFDTTRTVKFAEDFVEPREFPSKTGQGVFYVFDVNEGDEDKVIMTSAWTLLKQLKENQPLAGKELRITLVRDAGKQKYTVELA